MASRPRRLVGVQTKMYLSLAQTQAYITSLLAHITRASSLASQIEIFVLVDHVSIVPSIAQQKSTNARLLIGAQDASAQDAGAFTGQVSPAVLAEAGCAVVMVGHAERRRCGETDALVASKAAAVTRNGMVPLVCFGEDEGGGGVEAAVDVCRAQVEAVLGGVPDESEVVLAYEPVWAIGAAEPAGEWHVVGVTAAIRGLACVKERKGPVRILYGGSAGPGLFGRVKDGVDGLFMARAGLDVERFWKVVGEVAEA
ncbi:putative triosephosphate isomerase 2 [Colletotrichum chlorophyti]|uniref:Triosephosphate isomerase n=1 Tax=Colletotrichum chlorophyti TaxID=708187 RepID=A0A1Q8S8H1_9PEZI|nr:putative triosephosphate isomerase 2 [Colletotrichum chlorophyti]